MWSKNCEDAVNKQINLEMYASYTYQYLFSFFNRNTVAFRNIAKFFNKCSLEEREHANKFIEYQNKRGGKVILTDIKKPEDNNYNTVMSMKRGFELALQLEKTVYENLLELHKIGETDNDPQFTDFIESEFLEEQINAIDELNLYITELRLIDGNGHGLWNFDLNFKI